MSSADHDRLQRLIDRCTSTAGVDGDPLVPLDDGELLLAIVPDVELIELRVTPLPLLGGTSSFFYDEAAAMARQVGRPSRGIELEEPVPARDRGEVMITNRRVTFVGAKTRQWTLARLQDITHDPNVPETWLAVSNRKRLSGLRYVGHAVGFRFAVALAVADARGHRSMLASSLRRQQLTHQSVVEPVAATSVAVAAAATSRSTAGARLSAIVLGKPGTAMPLRILQTAAVALVALVLLVQLVPGGNSGGAKDASVTLTDAGAGARGAASAPSPTAGAAVETAAADKVAADKVAADKAAADKAAAEKAAADKAAADKAAADKAAADKAAADRAAVDKAAADKAAADRAAADSAAAQAPPAAAGDAGTGCTPEYPDFCIPQKPGDAYNCPDFTQKNFTAQAPDPYRLDADHDGIACERR